MRRARQVSNAQVPCLLSSATESSINWTDSDETVAAAAGAGAAARTEGASPRDMKSAGLPARRRRCSRSALGQEKSGEEGKREGYGMEIVLAGVGKPCFFSERFGILNDACGGGGCGGFEDGPGQDGASRRSVACGRFCLCWHSPATVRLLLRSRGRFFHGRLGGLEAIGAMVVQHVRGRRPLLSTAVVVANSDALARRLRILAQRAEAFMMLKHGFVGAIP